MLRPRGPRGLDAKSFGLGLTWPRPRPRPRPHALWPGPRPRKKFWASASSSLFLVSASCPAGLVNIPEESKGGKWSWEGEWKGMIERKDRRGMTRKANGRPRTTLWRSVANFSFISMPTMRGQNTIILSR